MCSWEMRLQVLRCENDVKLSLARAQASKTSRSKPCVASQTPTRLSIVSECASEVVNDAAKDVTVAAAAAREQWRRICQENSENVPPRMAPPTVSDVRVCCSTGKKTPPKPPTNPASLPKPPSGQSTLTKIHRECHSLKLPLESSAVKRTDFASPEATPKQYVRSGSARLVTSAQDSVAHGERVFRTQSSTVSKRFNGHFGRSQLVPPARHDVRSQRTAAPLRGSSKPETVVTETAHKQRSTPTRRGEHSSTAATGPGRQVVPDGSVTLQSGHSLRLRGVQSNGFPVRARVWH